MNNYRNGTESRTVISNGVKLLILTQAVDLDDPVLGFFHRWIEEFSTRAEHIEVICLKEGKHALPKNVRVHSLGKPYFAKASQGTGARIKYVLNFYRYIWQLRHDYDAVFVHMNEEYVVLGGGLWHLLGKRIILWRNFKTGSWMTPLASRLAHTVCYTSPDSFTRRYPNAVQMPIGIDTDVFKSAEMLPAPRTLLFFGRLDEIKRPDLFLDALELLARKGTAYEAHLVGDPTPGNETYAEELKRRYENLSHVSFYSGVSNEEAPAVYREHSVYVNLTPSGSFDKTIGEAMSSGCVVVTCNSAVGEILPPALFVSDGTSETVARSLDAALNLSPEERETLTRRGRDFIVNNHSLRLLSKRLFALLGS